MKKIKHFSLLLLLFLVFAGCSGDNSSSTVDATANTVDTIEQDTTAPDTKISFKPANLTNSTTVKFEFSSNESNSTFECNINSGSWEVCTSPKTFTVSDGSNTFEVRAIDKAGNIDSTPASYTWTVDTTKPETTIDTYPVNPTNSTTATFSFSSNESNSTFECKINSGSWKVCTSPKTFKVSAGSNTFEVRAIDKVGNVDSTPATYTWTVIHFKYISSGDDHNCGIKTDGTLYCWGRNNNGQLGDNTSIDSYVPVQENSESTNWVYVSAGGYDTCGVRADGTLYCWGGNNYGQLGNGTTNNSNIPVQENSASTIWKSVSSGIYHTCGVKTDGTLYCWGYNYYGQLGDGTSNNSNIPVQEYSQSISWVSVSSGIYHTCGVKTDGTLYCWGYNNYGQLGDGTNNNSNIPVQEYSQSTSWISVSVGQSHTCGVRTNGTLWCWGDNHYGQLGDGTTNNSNIPVQEYSQSTSWVSVSSGESFTCGVKTNDTLYCWGRNNNGQLGDGTNSDRNIPVQEYSQSISWESVSAGEEHTCSLKTDGSLYCWGYNYYGQLGNTSPAKKYPSTAQNKVDWEYISSGYNYSCGVKTDGTLYCWGYNYYGQLGDNTTNNKKEPVQEYSKSVSWESVSVRNNHTCGIKFNGTLWCWGYNRYGRLGDNTTTERDYPVQEYSESIWESVSVGENHTCGVKTDGTLWCWGYNGYGQLGDGTTISKKVPVQENSNSINWESVSAGALHSCGVKTNGTLYCWGYNGNGMLGNGTNVNSNVPVQEDSVSTTWVSVSVGREHTCGVKTDGTLWCWGKNLDGQLGDNTTTDKDIPVQEYSQSTSWESVSAGRNHTCGVKTDGDLWCWGKNSYGQLGDNTIIDSYIPVRESSRSSNWESVSSGGYHTCGIKTDDSLYCWGEHKYGQLGYGLVWYETPQYILK